MATVTFIRNTKQSPGALGGVANYVMQRKKTNGGLLISGQNCSPPFAAQEFLATRQMHRKESPIYFYQYVQSFHPKEEITGKQAHEIAREFAAKAWPQSEVLIATHIDAEHIHSHFIVNAVCCESGRMLRQGPKTLATLRPLSDAICLAHGLSVLTPKTKVSGGMNTREYRSAVRGESWKLRLANTIDECMKYALTRDEFIALMRSEGYELRWSDARKCITYTCPNGRKCRDDKLHEMKYRKEKMEHEFRIREEIILGGTEAAKRAVAGAPDRGRNGQAAAHGLGAGAAHPLRELDDGGAGRGDLAAASLSELAAGTGWEAERAAFFAAEAVSDAALDPDAPGGVLGDVVRLGHAVDGIASDVPVIDATARRAHIDAKRRRELRRKRIAAGHREDDHEEESDHTQSMN